MEHISPKSNDDVTSQHSLLVKLPNEIWSLVFSFIPSEDNVKHRLVSKWWRKNVDELSTVHVNRITDSIPSSVLTRMFELRVRSCGMSNLRSPFEPNFNYPLLVKEITFGTNISSDNMLKILSTCSNIENLSFFTTIGSDISFKRNEESFKLLNKLKSLKNIEIGIHSFAARNLTISSSTFETLIGSESVTFSALNKLSVTYIMYHFEWRNLFSFIARHANTITSLNIKCQCVGSQSDTDGIISKMVNFISNDISKLAEMNLKSLIVQNDNHPCNCKIEEVWMAILSSQNSLEVVSTDLIPKLPFILELVRRNVNTLRSVSFYDVLLELGDILDGSIFSLCNFLEVLKLQFIPAYVVMVDIHDVAKKPTLSNFDFTGLSLLPKSLVKLSLQGCDMLSSDLLEMSSRLCKLKELEFGSPGTSICANTKTGVTFEIFKIMCQNFIDLKNLKLHKDILNMRSVTKCGSNGSPNFSLWDKVIDTAKSLEVYGNMYEDLVPCYDNTNVYEFNLNTITRPLFSKSLYELEKELSNHDENHE